MKNYGELLQSYFIFLHRRLYFSSAPEFQLKKFAFAFDLAGTTAMPMCKTTTNLNW